MIVLFVRVKNILFIQDGLPFKQGDCIEIISMDATGLWRGKVGGRTGVFKFIYVRVCTEQEEEKILNRKHQDIRYSL